MTIQEKINLYMTEQNINSLRKFALKCKIPHTTLVSFLKTDVDATKLGTTKKIADAMGCTIDYLIYDDITDKNSTKEYDIKDNIEELYKKVKPYLSDDDKEMLIYIMNRAIDKQEKGELNDN